MTAMAFNFLISGTGPGVGKTMVGCALAFAFKVRSMRVGVMKPVQTGCREREGVLAPEDAASLLAAASSDLRICRWSLHAFTVIARRSRPRRRPKLTGFRYPTCMRSNARTGKFLRTAT
jgi:AAA domain